MDVKTEDIKQEIKTEPVDIKMETDAGMWIVPKSCKRVLASFVACRVPKTDPQ